MEEHIENIEQYLIHDLKRGSHKAFDKIYQMYSKRLYAYSLQFTKSSEESEEIVQEVFVKLKHYVLYFLLWLNTVSSMHTVRE